MWAALAAAGVISWEAALAYAAYRSRRPSHVRQSMITFWPSAVASELAPQLLAAQAAVALAAARRLPAGPLAVSAVLAASASRDLLHMARECADARRLMREACTRAGLPLHRLAMPVPAVRRLAAALPVYPLLHLGNVVSHTEVYRRVGVHKLKVDVFQHRRNLRRAAPCVMYVHGGGWVAGHRGLSSLPLIYDLAAEGFLVLSVSYRLAPNVSLPEQLVDCKRALAWVKANAHRYGGDGTRVVVAGESAGGHLAALLALTPNAPQHQPGFERVDTSVLGCVDLYGMRDLLDAHGAVAAADPTDSFSHFMARYVMKTRREDDPEGYAAMSPVTYVRAEAMSLHDLVHTTVPPFMCVHGTNDTLIPVEDARQFVEELATLRRKQRQLHAVAASFGAGEALDVAAFEDDTDGGAAAAAGDDDTGSSDRPTQPPDVYIELPGAHHAFNFMLSSRTLALGDAVRDFVSCIVEAPSMRAAPAAFPVTHEVASRL